MAPGPMLTPVAMYSPEGFKSNTETHNIVVRVMEIEEGSGRGKPRRKERRRM